MHSGERSIRGIKGRVPAETGPAETKGSITGRGLAGRRTAERDTVGTQLLLQKKASTQRSTAIKRAAGITISNLHTVKASICVESTSLLLGGEQKETPLRLRLGYEEVGI